MALGSAIEWTQATWNPVTGCSKISEGCRHCYAERMSHRLQSMGLEKYRHGFRVVQHESALDQPLRWTSPKLIFVNSMSDLFHKDVEDAFVRRVFNVMNRCPQHTFQVLTKRPLRAVELGQELRWTNNIWFGVSIESEICLSRLSTLLLTRASTKFLSLEPLIDRLPRLELDGVDWVIAGGESGPGSRPMHPDWVREIRDRCVEHRVPFFFKQWGGVNKKRAGRVLDGRTWDQMPVVDPPQSKSAPAAPAQLEHQGDRQRIPLSRTPGHRPSA